MSLDLIPFSVVIPTWNRAAILRRTLESLAAQSCQPAQIILVDASESQATRDLCIERPVPGLASEVVWQAAQMCGAACQRNQGMQECRHAVIGFFDDDILFEPDCIGRLWGALQSDAGLGGVNALITNQRYQPPGRFSRFMFRLMAGRREESYAGRVLGPAVNLLPEDREDLPEIVPVQWLNTTCVLYRREVLPSPPFEPFFTGYSLGEDLALSLRVAKRSRLANARRARIYHDTQAANYKADVAALSRMALVNRHYIMTEVMAKNWFSDYVKLTLWESSQLLISAVRQQQGTSPGQLLFGKLLGARDILCNLGQMRRHGLDASDRGFGS